MKKLLDLHKGIGSFGLPRDSKSNWPIENFWLILQQEFLNVHRPINVKEAERLLTKIIFTYNHKKEYIKKLKWKLQP